MKHTFFSVSVGLFALASIGCSTHNDLEMGGVPKWIQEGAEISEEPEPMRPDPAILEFEDESGPVEWTLVTDKRRYPDPPVTKKESVSTRDPIEPGREYRIRRLFR